MMDPKLREKIAREILGLETLETRGWDQYDFHEIGVATLRKALEAAYEAGVAARGTQANHLVLRAEVARYGTQGQKREYWDDATGNLWMLEDVNRDGTPGKIEVTPFGTDERTIVGSLEEAKAVLTPYAASVTIA
jgi:hypothetical protein